MSETGRRIKEFREKKGLSQEELADLSNLTRVSIGNYERGIRDPKAAVLQAIAKALGVDINYLLDNSSVSLTKSKRGRVGLITETVKVNSVISKGLFDRVIDEIIELHKAKVLKDYSINMSSKGYSIHILNDSGSGAGLRGKLGGKYVDIGGFFDFLGELRDEIGE